VSLTAGTLIGGRYRIIRRLGEGGFGAVYLAEDMRLGGKHVAVKESFQNSPEAQAQFQLEAHLLANLDHPGLPGVTDNFVEADNRQFLVMDFIEGTELHDQISRTNRPLSEQEAVRLMLQVCEAVNYLHDQKPQPIIHRDIKPANIKMTREGRAVLVDFGIAKIYHPQKGTARVAKAISRNYSPPEQHIGNTDSRSDVYALGATLYHLVCADLPADAMARLTHGEAIVPPTRHNPRISQALERIILRALELNADLRFLNAGEMADELRALLSGKPTPAASPALTPTIICHRCGHINRSGAKFCAMDGTPLGANPVALPQVHFEIANEHARQRNYSQAIREYRECLRLGYKDSAVYHNLGLCHLFLKQYSTALQILIEGATQYPKDPELQFQLARAYFQSDQPAKAITALQQALRLKSDYPEAHFRLGLCYYQLGKLAESLHHLREATRFDPTLGQAYYLAGEILRKQNNYAEALGAYKQATALLPDDPGPHVGMAKCYVATQRTQEAKRATQRALVINPNHILAQELLRSLK
jgi:serine/threonine-protein kinase